MINIISLYFSEASAFSLRTVYEDAAASDTETFFFALACALVAYPLLLFASRFKLNKPTGYSEIQYWKLCIRISAKQLLPLLFLIYVARTFILLFVGVIFSIAAAIVLRLTDGNNFFQSINSLYFILMSVYLCWYIFSIFLSIKWLPKTVDGE